MPSPAIVHANVAGDTAIVSIPQPGYGLDDLPAFLFPLRGLFQPLAPHLVQSPVHTGLDLGLAGLLQRLADLLRLKPRIYAVIVQQAPDAVGALLTVLAFRGLWRAGGEHGKVTGVRRLEARACIPSSERSARRQSQQ